MKNVQDAVLARVGALLPGQIGQTSGGRWTNAEVEQEIFLATCIVAREVGQWRRTLDISLSTAASYDIDLSYGFISIDMVEFSADGSTFDVKLAPISFEDLDTNDLKWKSHTCAYPTHYMLSGPPGIDSIDGQISKIWIYPTLASSGASDIIRVRGYTAPPSKSSMNADFYTQGWFVDKLIVPFTMSLLMAPIDVQAATEYLTKYASNLDVGKRRTWNRSSQKMTRGEDL